MINITRYINLRVVEEDLEAENQQILEEVEELKQGNYSVNRLTLTIKKIKENQEVPFFLNMEDMKKILSIIENEEVKNMIENKIEEQIIREKNTFEIIAFDETGKTYPKEIYLKTDSNDKQIVNIGGYGYYLEDLFNKTNSLLNKETLCIDFAGRNHNGTSVFIKSKDLINLAPIQEYLLLDNK